MLFPFISYSLVSSFCCSRVPLVPLHPSRIMRHLLPSQKKREGCLTRALIWLISPNVKQQHIFPTLIPWNQRWPPANIVRPNSRVTHIRSVLLYCIASYLSPVMPLGLLLLPHASNQTIMSSSTNRFWYGTLCGYYCCIAAFHSQHRRYLMCATTCAEWFSHKFIVYALDRQIVRAQFARGINLTGSHEFLIRFAWRSKKIPCRFFFCRFSSKCSQKCWHVFVRDHEFASLPYHMHTST